LNRLLLSDYLFDLTVLLLFSPSLTFDYSTLNLCFIVLSLSAARYSLLLLALEAVWVAAWVAASVADFLTALRPSSIKILLYVLTDPDKSRNIWLYLC
jgi:hypothetical protein